MRRLALGLLVIGAGCSQILGIQDVTDKDGSGSNDGGVDAAPDGPIAPPNTVVGVYVTRCLPANTVVPFDLSASVIRALIPDPTAAGGYQVKVGTGRADGTFQIDDVPDGVEYTFNIGSGYYVTSVHALNMHSDGPQRCDPAPMIDQGTSGLSLDLTGTVPFIQQAKLRPTQDLLLVDSSAIAYTGTIYPGDGRTGFSDEYLWMDGGDYNSNVLPLVDQSAGDDLTITHQRITHTLTNGRSIERSSVVASLSPTGVVMQDGTKTSVAGALVPTPNNRSFQMFFNRALYDGAFASGRSVPGYANIAVYASPIANDYPLGVSLFTVNLSDWSHSSSLSYNRTESYADPFPTEWTRLLWINYDRFRYFLVPGSTVRRQSIGGYTSLLPMSAAPSFTPSLTAPANAKVGGVAFTDGGNVPTDGVAPVTVEWASVPTARVYTVRVTRYLPAGGASRPVATFQTPNTKIAIPGELFAAASFFSFTVAAVVSPADYAHGELLGNGVPSRVVTLGSGLFRIGSTCGNGVVDPGEECDGVAADCDVDCTRPICGDGLLNTLAGEQCDDAFDTPGCDLDCTPNTCGDGYVNSATEDCDTPNANSCGPTCRSTAVCGNGIVEPGEGCDGGASCNPDCFLPSCGDGYVNGSEQCDDGNQMNGDTCSSTCQST